jgi:stringent starvation protein B
MKKSFNEILEEICNSGMTPYIYVDTKVAGVWIPEGYDTHGKIILNISPKSVTSFTSGELGICFSASFNGTPEVLEIPYSAMLFVYPYEDQSLAKSLSGQSVIPVEPVAPVESKPNRNWAKVAYLVEK